MRTSEQLDQLGAALASAQGEMGAATRSAANPHLRTRYADLAAAVEAARRPLATHGLAVVQTVEVSEVAVAVTTRLLHSSGQWVEGRLALPWGESKGITAAQAIGSVITYARRYSLMAILGLAADDDDDGEAAGQRQTRPARRQEAPPAKQAEGEHHPSWEPAKGAFFAELTRLGWTYDDVVAVCSRLTPPRGRPSGMAPQQRGALLQWLATPAAREMLRAEHAAPEPGSEG